MPGAHRPDMEEVAPEFLQQRPRAPHIFVAATDHDGERAVLCLRQRARHRRVDQPDLLGAERHGEGLRPGRIGGAHVDDQRSRLQRRQRFDHDLAHHSAVGQHGEQDLGSLRGRAHGRMRAIAALVVGLHGVAGSGEVGRHGHAHGAEADEGYSFDANTSRAQRNAATAAGTPA